MSIEGMDLEQPQPQAERQPEDTGRQPEPDEEDDGLVETVQVGAQKMVPVGDLIKYRREARDAKRALADAAPRIQQAEAVAARLNEAQPYIDKLRNPVVLEHVDRLVKGTHATSTHVEQPLDDQEAKDTAEDLGFYTTDGQLDVARGRRVLERATVRAERNMQAQLAPLRAQTAQQGATAMRQRVDGMRDKDGAPLATQESLNEIWKMVPAELQQQPEVAFVLTLAAAGMDKYSGRRVAAPQNRPEYDAPIYSEAPGRRGGSGVSSELAALGKRVGLTEKDLAGGTGTQTRGGAISFE